MYDPEQITFFAKTDARGQEVPFGIKAKDRTRHIYVIGKTGMGKSTLLENMAAQDIQNGNGLAFIDPHGSAVETLLNYIPEERKDDVLYFAPFDTENPISFNVMEDVGADKRHLVVSGLMSVFKKIWVDAWSARMEYILSNTLLALLEYPDSTLLGVNRMLSDKVYRKKVIDNISDPAVKSFWVDEFLKYNERYMQEAGDAIKNKIGQFTSNPVIRNIIGQPHSSFNIREIMDQKKIMLINLSKGQVGEQNANLLGSMMTTRIYLAAMSRADLTPQQMDAAPNFYFYVDEFQSFANATFADILSEARKYKLNLTIAHQYIEQMEEEVRNAVFGNVGTVISFRVGPFDAEILETMFTPNFLAADIVNLGFAQIYLTLMIDGIGSSPFSAVTLPPIETPSVSYRDVVIDSSRKNFAKERAGVETAILKWHEPMEEERKPRKYDDAGNGAKKFTDKKTFKQITKKTAGHETEKTKSNNNERKLDDLRSVLKDLAGAEKERQAKKAEKDAATHQKEKPQRDAAESAKRDALRAAVTGAMLSPAQNQQTEKVDTKPAPERTQKSQPATAKQRSPKPKKPNIQTDQSATNTQQPANTDMADALRDAVASAINKNIPNAKVQPAGETSRTQSKPERTEKSKPKNQPARKRLPQQKQAHEPQQTDTTAEAYAEAKNLNPKQLARMMRVTGSDKNPLN